MLEGGECGKSAMKAKEVEQVFAWLGERDLPRGIDGNQSPRFFYHRRRRVAMRGNVMAPNQTVPKIEFSSFVWVMRHEQGVAGNRKAKFNIMVLTFFVLSILPGLAVGFPENESGTGQTVQNQTEKSDGRTATDAAGKETKKEHTMEEIVVTATRTEKSLSDVPAAMSVVTESDIQSRNIQTVDEAINELPGVFDQRVLPLDPLGDVMMRGIPGQQRNLVLLDGQPLNNGFDGLVNWNSLSPQDIARIEVARGPFSSLYGGDAMGGVVNIITKTPQQRNITIQSGYGSDNTWYEYASYGDKLYNRLSVFGSFSYRQSDGYPTIPVVVSPSGSGGTIPVRGAVPTTDAYGNPAYMIGNSGDNNWWTQSGSIKFVYDISEDSKATFSYRNNQYGYGYGSPQSFLFDSHGNNIFSGNLLTNGVTVPVTSQKFVADVNNGTFMENIFHGDYETKLFGDAVLKISGGIVDTPDNWYNQATSSTATHTGGLGQIISTASDLYNLDVQLSFPVLEKHLLTFGGSFRHDYADQPTTNLSNWTDTGTKIGQYSDFEGKDNIYSFFTQAEIALLHNLTLYAGVRGDYWRTYDGFGEVAGAPGYPQYYGADSDFSANPKGSLVYKPLDGTTFRSSIGTSFRPPTVYEALHIMGSLRHGVGGKSEFEAREEFFMGHRG